MQGLKSYAAPAAQISAESLTLLIASNPAREGISQRTVEKLREAHTGLPPFLSFRVTPDAGGEPELGRQREKPPSSCGSRHLPRPTL